MTAEKYPIVTHWNYMDSAILDVTVTQETPLDGNSGNSRILFEVGGGSIWPGTEERDVDTAREFTIQLAGESEHKILADALRKIAAQLDGLGA